MPNHFPFSISCIAQCLYICFQSRLTFLCTSAPLFMYLPGFPAVCLYGVVCQYLVLFQSWYFGWYTHFFVQWSLKCVYQTQITKICNGDRDVLQFNNKHDHLNWCQYTKTTNFNGSVIIMKNFKVFLFVCVFTSKKNVFISGHRRKYAVIPICLWLYRRTDRSGSSFE